MYMQGCLCLGVEPSVYGSGIFIMVNLLNMNININIELQYSLDF